MNELQPIPIPGGEYADVGSRMARTLSIFAAYPLVFLMIALPNVLTSALIGLIGNQWEREWRAWLSLIVILSSLVSEVVFAAACVAALRALSVSAPTIVGSYSIPFARFGALFIYMFRYLGAIFLLAITIVGIPFAIRLGIRWSFGTQAIVLYDDHPTDAIDRSARLTTGNWWRVLGNFLLIGLILALGLLVRFFVGDGIAGGLFSLAYSAVTAPLLAIFVTLLFLRLSAEKGEFPPTAIAWGSKPATTS